MPDIIKQFKNEVSKHTDAPEEFIEAAGYHLVSCSIGKDFRIAKAKGLTGKRPNLWFLLSSIPGRFRRSTVQDYHKKAFKEAVIRYKKGEKDMSRSESIDFFRKILLESGSPEGMTDHIQDYDSNNWVIMSHEYGGILENLKRQSYQKGLRDLLSKLYYGQGGYSYFSTKGKGKSERFVPPDQYVTMFTGIQDPRSYITEELFEQGLMRRIIVVKIELDDQRKEEIKENWKDYISDSGKSGGKEMKKLGATLGKRMISSLKFRKKLKRKPSGNRLWPLLQIDYMPNAKRRINEFSKKYDNNIIDEQDLQNMYLQSQGEKLDKLSSVSALSRGNFKRVEGEPIIHVEIEDVKRSERFLNKVSKGWIKIIPDIGTKKAPTTTITSPAKKILTTINKNGSVMDRSKFLQKVNMLKNEAKDVCVTLIERGQLFVAQDKTEGRGRDAMYFATNLERLKENLKAPDREEVGENYDGPVATVLTSDKAHRLESLW